ncbi:DUF3240 family protein [Hyphomonas sp. WL0036]|uniref:DUF3240 family protein n=1 Tax=Hyphomonas sediminis TaxID=2866160 RepID=UPI001C7EA360|nr:DUF3240 family protein [Hyphomonas sediminis]MBY9068212.1 DUF3240 family protein [Hyphomonas sediminis]
MDTTLRKLTLVAPALIQVTLMDCLDAIEPALAGYTVLTGEGRGDGADLPTAAERVRGAMRVVTVLMVVPEREIAPILEAVRQACPRPNIAYWVEPILEFGRLK